jgi:hypothetical protein
MQTLLKTLFPFQLLILNKKKKEVRDEYLDAQKKYKKIHTL